jgi:phosphomannomutase/phosphoglucomutase
MSDMATNSNAPATLSDPDAPPPKTIKRFSALELRARAQQKRFIGFCVLALGIGLVGSYLLHKPLVVESQKTRVMELSQQEVELRQARMLDYFRQQSELLRTLPGRSEFIDAVSATSSLNAAEDPNNIAARWLRTIPDGLNLQVFSLGSASLDRDAHYPIRYAELDLIARTETGARTQPELNKIKGQWVINWPLAIPQNTEKDAPILGSLLVVMDAKPLLAIFKGGDNTLGRFELHQDFNNQQIVPVAAYGEGDYANKVHNHVPGTYLKITFTPSQKLIHLAKDFPSLWISLSALILACLLSLAVMAHRALCHYEQKHRPLKVSKTPIAPSNTDTTIAKQKHRKELTDEPMNPLFQHQDILDVTMIDEDDSILSSLTDTDAKTTAPVCDIPADIFRSYDIRGIVGTQITPQLVHEIGRALGSLALEQGEHSLLVGRDGRTHSPQLAEALINGILKTGCHVIDIGLVPTPVLYFSTFHHPDTKSGVMLTASHNPKAYNGIKVVMNNHALADEKITALRARIIEGQLKSGEGQLTHAHINDAYIERIANDVVLANHVHVVIDAGNAVPGLIAPQLFRELGCEVTELYCELDGEFPHHDPDPTDANNLLALIEKVAEVGADLGIAFDGDGDRLMLVSASGDIIWPDRLMMVFARDLLQRHPGADILFDVKCSRQLQQVITSYGGRPIMWKTGHSPMKAKMVETDALLGGEYSGHIFIKDRWYGFDDGLYAAARFLEIMTLRAQSVDEIFASFPCLITTPELKIPCNDQRKFALIEQIATQGDFAGGKITQIDGVKVDFPKGWGLVRASNTSPALTLRFEADDDAYLQTLKQLFKRELLKADSSLSLPF